MISHSPSPNGVDLLNDQDIIGILSSVRCIALVGASDDPERPSHYVMAYLQHRGYRVIPVSPRLAGETLLGETVYSDVTSIPTDIQLDMVELFINAQRVPAVAEQAIERPVKVVWMQLGVIDQISAQKLRQNDIVVAMNRCPKIEIPRLGL
ncbi:MAG: CoA-binding protein [Pseudomonadales bacterium]|nr:CoA-binding protein [Pseudomonadales bacterium]